MLDEVRHIHANIHLIEKIAEVDYEETARLMISGFQVDSL
jgi:hypothetical protein